ncbi:IclR family transcriptional regulator [Marinobacter oulmenensis]|uniref:DNA-binding IclR family transcriptional regulator n=1 Tax=Marinobacter oulmenensis TaxID=643747 RepID=A0A840UG53_9GAMM|nr:IclR family transcriptional regulator [Marinobacter oulmenensis]MBB5321701.1 DNA-binding IclR family transcriptional regulator [Marinobacter oulmenensis]
MTKNRVESVERALKLLNTFRTEDDAWTLAQLAEKTGFYKSTILRIMGSLERFGYVARGEDGLHRPGPALFRLERSTNTGINFEAVIRPYLKMLRDETGQTASFYIRDGDDRICLLREIGNGELRHYVEEGSRLELDRGAAARALTTPDDNDGVHMSFGERIAGVAAIAVPVYDDRDQLLGAVTLSGSTQSITPAQSRHFALQLKDVARQIRTQL